MKSVNKTITNEALEGNYIEYESRGDNDYNLSFKEYLDIIRPYLKDMIIIKHIVNGKFS